MRIGYILLRAFGEAEPMTCYYIRACDMTGAPVEIATEDIREALQSFRAFVVARFEPVTVSDESGDELLECDLIDLAERLAS